MMRCLNCFKEFDETTSSECPHCHEVMNEFHNKSNCLQPGVMLGGGRYIVGKALNAGGFGIVYRAFDNTLEIIVAIKEFFPSHLASRVLGTKEVILIENNRGLTFAESKESFLNEARIMEKFKNNDNIVGSRDWFEENNTAYIVMDYIEGINVRDYLLQFEDKKLDLESAQWIAKQMINALRDIHEAGYVFRDLTPDNIMITTDTDENGNNYVKLIDFGAAVNINTEVDTAKDDVILKPGYAPIEQYKSGGVLGSYTDIYALGATIYRILTGVVPYEVTDRDKEDHLEKLTDFNSTIPEYIDRTVMKAMAIDKKIRFQNIDEFEAAFINEKEVLYPEEELRKLKRRKYGLFSLLFVLCIALGIGVFYIKSKRDVGIKNIVVSKDTITVMLPINNVRETEYLQEIISDYEKENEQITVDASFVAINDYIRVLNEKKELPTVFFNNGYISNDSLADLSELLDSINLDNYKYFSSKENFKYAIPLGFDATVCYTNTSMSNNIEKMQIDHLKTNKVAYNLQYFQAISNQIDDIPITNLLSREDFLNEKTAYYVGGISEWEDIYKKFSGYWNVIPFTDTVEVKYGDYVSINKNTSTNKQHAGMLFIYELLSDLAQDNRYLQCDNHVVPVNNYTYEKYMKAHKEMLIIDEMSNVNQRYLTDVEKNKKLVSEKIGKEI